MNIFKFQRNSWIGMILGGIIGFTIISLFNLSYYFNNYFVTINIVSLIIIFCFIYYKFFKLLKNSKAINKLHLLFVNALIGAVFGLFVGFMSNEGEIYWFVFGFLFLSLIPLINTITVVFWLGSTIYFYYFPNNSIPIFNDFLPIHLMDSSIREITSLPLFILPTLIFLGYLIPVLVTKSKDKRKIILYRIDKEKELKNEMNKYNSKLKKWKIEGYETNILEEKQKSGNFINKIEIFKDYESKIQKLKKFEKDLHQLDVIEFDYDIISIKRKIKNPYKVDEIESDLSALKKRIKLEIEKLIKKTDNEIKNAFSDAIDENNSHWLSSLKILQKDLFNYSRELESMDILYKHAINKIKELHDKAVKLNAPHKKKIETPPITQIKKPNYYEIFNIKPNATQEQIKKMFKRLTLAFHPDAKEETGVDGDRKFRMVIEAYEILKDPNKRKKYDQEIGLK